MNNDIAIDKTILLSKDIRKKEEETKLKHFPNFEKIKEKLLEEIKFEMEYL